MNLNEAEMAYQPKIRRNKLVSIEALLRPKNCLDVENFVKNYKSPVHLDSKVLELVYSDIIDTKINYPVSINASYFSLISNEFINKVIALFKGLNITIELTEHFDIKNIEKLKMNIEILRGNKINVSLDDFGKDFSRAKLLSEIKFNEVKIDKSIIDYIDKDYHSYKHLVFLSEKIKTFGTNNIVYEGIERLSQFQLINLFDNNAILQGYFYSKPISMKEIINHNYEIDHDDLIPIKSNVFDDIEVEIYKIILSNGNSETEIINNKIKNMDIMGGIYNEDYNKTISNFKSIYYKDKMKA